MKNLLLIALSMVAVSVGAADFNYKPTFVVMDIDEPGWTACPEPSRYIYRQDGDAITLRWKAKEIDGKQGKQMMVVEHRVPASEDVQGKVCAVANQK